MFNLYLNYKMNDASMPCVNSSWKTLLSCRIPFKHTYIRDFRFSPLDDFFAVWNIRLPTLKLANVAVTHAV